MENQHKLITGYRDLTKQEIDRMNQIKQQGDALGDLVELMTRDKGADQRWVSIGKTHLQQGIMALVRSVAKPESF